MLARQQAFNRRTRGNAEEFGLHRHWVTTQIVKAADRADGCLAVLGAGNANDLDLPVLVEAFKQVHLVDLDSEALSKALIGAADTHPEVDSVIRLHGEIDLGGIAELLDRIAGTPRDTEIDRLIAAAKHVSPADLDFSCNVVASTCLLTQLMNSAVAAVGEGHPRLLELLDAIRTSHLRLLTDLTAPGGTALLFTDIAFSDDTPESALPALTARLTREKRFFLGVDPNQVEKQLRSDPHITSRAKTIKRIGFWTWRISKARTFLVYAVAIQC